MLRVTLLRTYGQQTCHSSTSKSLACSCSDSSWSLFRRGRPAAEGALVPSHSPLLLTYFNGSDFTFAYLSSLRGWLALLEEEDRRSQKRFEYRNNGGTWVVHRSSKYCTVNNPWRFAIEIKRIAMITLFVLCVSTFSQVLPVCGGGQKGQGARLGSMGGAHLFQLQDTEQPQGKATPSGWLLVILHLFLTFPCRSRSPMHPTTNALATPIHCHCPIPQIPNSLLGQ